MSSKVLEPPTPKAGKETVYIDVEDEITTIIDKVEAAKAKIVALVLPKRAATLQSVVNMRLLKRSAERASKTIVLITSDGALLPLAGAAGIYVAKNLQTKPEVPPSPLAAETESATPEQSVPVSGAGDEEADIDSDSAKIDYNRSIGELAAAHEMDEPEVIALGDDEELPEPTTPKSSAPKGAKSQKLKVPNFERFRLLLFSGIALLVALIVFIFLAVAVLPKATVAITTSSTPIAANLTLNASDKYTTLNETASQIPASLKASNQTSQQTVNATGQQNQGNRASGTVSISNCTNSAVTIPAGTGVSTGGLTFITQKSLALDSGNFTSSGACKSSGSHVGSVSVTAVSGGSKYNIDSGQTFSVSNEPKDVSGTNGSAFTGGTDNNVTVVSQADVDGARSKVTSQSSDDYTNKFISQLESSGFYVLRSTLKVGDPQVTANPAVGQQASSTNVSIQITYTVLVVQKSDLQKVISDTLNEQIDKSRQKISSSDVVKDASITVQNQTAPAAVTLNVSEGTTAVPIINVAQVKQLTAGKKSGDIKNAILTWPGVKDVNVKMSPFWVSKAPKNQNKITVTLNQVKQ